MQFDFNGQRVVVSGAAQGLGRAIAGAFASAGAEVHAVDIDGAGLDGFNHETHTVDVGDMRRAEALFARLAPVDVLVCAAGGVVGRVGAPIEDVSEADWRAVISANLDTAFFSARAAAVGMKARGSGRIVFLSSGAGLRASLTGIQPYAAAKHAVVGLTRQLALELGPAGITVNSVAPGFVLSNPNTQRQWQALGEDGQLALVNSIHRRRLGTPQDVTAATLFLCSAEADWITGQVLSVDGGKA